MLLNQGVFSQRNSNKKVTLSGYVLNESGAPVSGVAFFVDDVKITKVTNEKGFYKIKLRPGKHSIVAMKSLAEISEIEYSGQDTINFFFRSVAMPLDTQVLEPEDVVDMGYKEVKKSDVSTSISTLDGDQLNKTHYSNIFEMIRGQVPGVVVSGNSITIRGKSSFNLSSQPLFVVNGVVASSIDNISPREVESINILKGAAAAIYGSKGTNGVIVIKLKGGN